MKSNMALATVLCVLMLSTSCTARRNVRVARLLADDPYWAQALPTKDESTVLVTEGDLQRKYHPIARIFVDSVGWKKEVSFARMRQEGAKIGADAVIRIKVSTQYEGQVWNRYGGRPRNRHTLEGLAVIYDDE